MSASDDDPLAGVDLKAWQPPPAPAGLADAVIRRMREPITVTAHELEDRPRRRLGLWLAAGALVAGVTAAVGVLALGAHDAPSEPDHGDVVAGRASHLEIGATSAELDAGTSLAWRRDGARITVAQHRGAVTWRVGTADSIAIEPGAMGASVEASGASLRVEVHMQLNGSDAKVVGASAATAAVVALVTVIVYQGHVKVTSSGQTVNVAAGSAVEVRPGEPPREVPDVAGAPPDHTVAADSADTRPNITPPDLERLRIKGNRSIMPDDFVKRAMQTAGDAQARVIASFKLCVDRSGKVSETRVLKSSGYPAYDQKIETEMKTWEFRPYEIDGKASGVCTAVTFIYKQQ